MAAVEPRAKSRSSLWPAAMLVPHPPLSLLYLLAVRQSRVMPSFAPLLLLTAFPLGAFAAAVYALARRRSERRSSIAILCVAVVELAWATLALAIAGIAIGLRSG